MLSTTLSSPKIILISPCRNEERTLKRTIHSVQAQTIKPLLWIIVDDGSSDKTEEIIAEAMTESPWIQVVRRKDRGFRKVGPGVVDAFYAGFECIETLLESFIDSRSKGQKTLETSYDYVAKMDVDLEFPPNYLEQAMHYFAEDPKLAAVSGKVFREDTDGRIEEFMIDDMVAGQFKLYKKEAFAKIGGFVREVMWDGIDFHRCRMEGFKTRSIDDKKMAILHLRLMGSSEDSIYRGRKRWGYGQWFMGSSLIYVIASGIFRMKEKPYIIGGLLIIWGYLKAALSRKNRYDDLPFRKSLRRWQYERLLGLLKGKGVR